MLSPQLNLTKLLASTLSLTTTLLCLLIVNSARAENTEHYRQEPIFPIPLHVEVDSKKAALGEMLFFDTQIGRAHV